MPVQNRREALLSKQTPLRRRHPITTITLRKSPDIVPRANRAARRPSAGEAPHSPSSADRSQAAQPVNAAASPGFSRFRPRSLLWRPPVESQPRRAQQSNGGGSVSLPGRPMPTGARVFALTTTNPAAHHTPPVRRRDLGSGCHCCWCRKGQIKGLSPTDRKRRADSLLVSFFLFPLC